MPDANTLTIGMMAVLAQYEREIISDRTKAGLAEAKKRGKILGNPNLQLIRNSNTTSANRQRKENANFRNKQLIDLISEIEEASVTTLTLEQISDKLNLSGYLTARGNRFTKSHIHRLKKLALHT